jgi:hypothetical protein
MAFTSAAVAVIALGLPLLPVLLLQMSPEEALREWVLRVFLWEICASVAIGALFGAMLPVAGWIDLGWRGLAFAAGVILLRRLP